MKLGKIFDQIKRKGLLPACFLILLALAGGGRPVYAEEMTGVTENTKVMDVIEDPDFEGFGRLIFPADKTIDPDLELKDVGDILTWYNYVNPERTVEIVNYMKEQAEEGEQIFYDIYTEKKKRRIRIRKIRIVFLPRRSRREIRSGKCRWRFLKAFPMDSGWEREPWRKDGLRMRWIFGKKIWNKQ